MPYNYLSLGTRIQLNYILLMEKRNNSVGDSWRMDEIYIKVKGKWHYLYRAIDSPGLTLDIWLRKKSDSHSRNESIVKCYSVILRL